MEEMKENGETESARPTGPADDSKVPVLRSIMVLRRESFGGYLFNPYMPPETRLDRVKFKIASGCDGQHTLGEIKEAMGRRLDHSKEYVDDLVNRTLQSFSESFAIHWRDSKLVVPRVFEHPSEAPAQEEDGRLLSAPLFVIWEVTRACNLKCKHCLSNAGNPMPDELSTEEAKSLIDALAEMKVFYLNISGGEPFVRRDIFELLEYASKKRMGIDVLTNGTLVTEEVVDRLEKTNVFHVQVSLDGIGETHDSFRGIRGSFDRSVEAIKLLRSRNYEVAVSSAVTKKNLGEIPRIIDLAAELGANLFKTTIFLPTGRGAGNMDELVLESGQVQEFAIMLKRKKEEVRDRISIANEEMYPWLLQEDSATPKDTVQADSSRLGCTAGNSSLYIMPDGSFAPCPFLRGFTAGQFREGSLEDVWRRSSVFGVFRNIKKGDLKGKCHDCEYLGSLCFGGCRAAAFAFSGDILSEDPMCWKDPDRRGGAC